MRSSWILVMAFGMGCDIHSDSATTSTPSSTCWFCIDTGTSTPPTTGSTKTETTKDTAKPTTYYGTDTTKDYGWSSFSFNTNTGTGDIYYYVEDCALDFEAVSSKPLGDCAECLFAVAINLSDPYVMDGAGCDDDPAMEVTQLRYGHSDAGLYAQEAEGAAWVLVDGSSKMYETEWYFTYAVD
jgi:hypothetical protein